MNSTGANAENRYRVVFVAGLAGTAVLQAFLATRLPLTHQEGLNLLVSRLINNGYAPYTEIFTLANPLFVGLLGWLGRLGLTPTGFRGVFLAFSTLLLIDVALIARHWFGWQAALASAFLLAGATTFLGNAAGIAPVIPAQSVGGLSLLLTLHYLKSSRLTWQFLAGVLWGIALFVSISALSLALVNLLLVVFAGQARGAAGAASLTRGNVLRALGTWLAGAIIAVAAGVALASPEIVFEHILATYSTIGHNLRASQAANFKATGHFLVSNLWLALFAVAGITQADETPDHPLWIAVMWGLFSFSWLMLQRLLQPVDLDILLPPLAIVAGWGLVGAGQRLHRYYRGSRPARHRALGIGLGLLFLGLYVAVTWRGLNGFIWRDIDNQDYFTQYQRRQEVVELIQAHTAAGDCVIIDDAALAVAADRLPAPQLVGLSRERLAAGLITREEFVAVVEENGCTAAVFSSRRYTLSELRDWARTYYPHEQRVMRTRIYYR